MRAKDCQLLCPAQVHCAFAKHGMAWLGLTSSLTCTTAGDERLSPAETSPSSSSASGRRSASRTSRLLAPLFSTTLMRPPAAACDKCALLHVTCCSDFLMEHSFGGHIPRAMLTGHGCRDLRIGQA